MAQSTSQFLQERGIGIDSLCSPSLDSQHHRAIYWAKSTLLNILLYETSMIFIIGRHFDQKHRCLVEMNVLIVYILHGRWHDGAESLEIEHTSCLWHRGGVPHLLQNFTVWRLPSCLSSFDNRQTFMDQDMTWSASRPML